MLPGCLPKKRSMTFFAAPAKTIIWSTMWPEPRITTKKRYRLFPPFTKKFVQAVTKAESDQVKQTCGGKYTGDLCGLDFDPILCAQDFSASGYLYRTMEDDGRKAIVLAIGVDFIPEAVKTSYRFIKDGKQWKLDGAACGGGGEFNMDCGSSACPKVSDLREKSGQGDANAQYTLGVMYNIGRGVQQDIDEAESWFLKAAKQGHADAQSTLGYIYKYSLKQDHAKAENWFLKAAEQGDADAQFYLGSMFEDGWGVERNYAEAEKWYRKAAGQGNVGAQYYLGMMYQAGQGVEKNYAEAEKWLRKAAELGKADAQYNLGMMYQAGQGVEKNYAEAEKWLRKAAERRHTKAKHDVEKLDRR